MTRIFYAASMFLLAALLVSGMADIASAQTGQVYVLESTASTVKVGTAYTASDRITVPAGGSIRIVMPSGKTQTLKGPYSGSVSDLTKGQKSNDSVIAWIKTLLQTGGSNERTPGATRSMRAQAPAAAFSWTAIPVTVDSTICVQKGAELRLRRVASPRAERIKVMDEATAQGGEAEFVPGSETASWPTAIIPKSDATYTLVAQDSGARRKLTIRVLDALPNEDDILAELAKRDCKYQFDAWVKDKTAAGKGKAS